MNEDSIIIPEQLHAKVPGGIGLYTSRVLSGLIPMMAANSIPTRIYGSRRIADHDPFENLGSPIIFSRLDHRSLVRFWDSRFARLPKGARSFISFSMAAPLDVPVQKSAVAIYDLAFRRFPETMTKRGVVWHENRLKRIRQSSARVITISEESVEELVEEGIDRARICLAPPGSDHLASADLVSTEQFLEKIGVDSPFLLSIGTLEPRKNLSRLFLAVKESQSELKERLPLLVVGPKGWGEEVEPQDGVWLCGQVSPSVLTGLLLKAAALVYVPLYEGFGLPPIEAMSCGTPVVASLMPSTTNASAIIVDPTSAFDIARGITEVLSNSERRATIVQEGLVRSSSMTWKNAASRIYEDLILG